MYRKEIVFSICIQDLWGIRAVMETHKSTWNIEQFKYLA
jgi:hypothetical protein